ncbi:unnamed protein product [Trichogramma brassicae]|uniref:Uncharacterized protein n=1 Tax=Trichogramma brassicae TaxID=86971 RepID=A0A6H5J562_9HYME|nr:unnamed protein product [Trichogramma brassicae]
MDTHDRCVQLHSACPRLEQHNHQALHFIRNSSDIRSNCWIAPVTVRAKILLQHLWLLGHDLDQLADPTTTRMWISFREQLPALQQCQIPDGWELAPRAI